MKQRIRRGHVLMALGVILAVWGAYDVLLHDSWRGWFNLALGVGTVYVGSNMLRGR